MPFHQPLFVFGFLPVVWLGYALLSRRGIPGLVVPWLLLSSMVFYAAEDLLHLAIVAGSIIGNFAVARQLQACDDRIARKRMLALAIVANIALLVFYKARLSPWFAGNGLAAFRTGDVATLLIPLGLSFLTFEQIGALMDIHRRRVALGTLTEYSLFVMFFPHLVMGPIVAYRDLAPQLKPAAIRQPTARALAGGLFIFSVGLFKKSVLSDLLAPYVDSVFAAVAKGDVSTGDAWLGAIGFQFQLYFDFSAYADMAIGLACMFGIRLPMNFDAPFRARNLFETFMRWHITFVVFLRDYVMRPLARQKIIPMPVGVAVLATTVVSGLWHGMTSAFLVWGSGMGTLLLLFHGWTQFRRRRGWPEAPVFVQVAFTFLMVVMIGIAFRSVTLETMGAYFMALVPHNGSGILRIDAISAALMVLCAFVIWVLPTLPTWMGAHGPGMDVRSQFAAPTYSQQESRLPVFAIDWRWGLLAGALLTMGMLMQGPATRFVYYQF